MENQDGGIGRHTALLAQPELTPVGGAETGTGAERTCVAVVGLRLTECGTKGAGSLTTSRPCSPTFAHR